MMGVLGTGLAAAGVIVVTASWLLTRADKVTLGEGASCLATGILLIFVGVFNRVILSLLERMGLRSPETGLLLLIVFLLLLARLKQAVIVSRSERRARSLAQDLALAREEKTADS